MILALLTFAFGLWQVFVQRNASTHVIFVWGIVAVSLSSVPLALQSVILMVELVRARKYFFKLLVHRSLLSVLGEPGRSASLAANYFFHRKLGNYGDVGPGWMCVAYVSHCLAKILGGATFGDAFSGTYHTRKISTVVWLEDCKNVWGLVRTGNESVAESKTIMVQSTDEEQTRVTLSELSAIPGLEELAEMAGVARAADTARLKDLQEEIKYWAGQAAGTGGESAVSPETAEKAVERAATRAVAQSVGQDAQQTSRRLAEWAVRWARRKVVLKEEIGLLGQQRHLREMRMKKGIWEMLEMPGTAATSGQEERQNGGELITPWFKSSFGSTWGVLHMNGSLVEPVVDVESLRKDQVRSKTVRQLKLEACFYPSPAFGPVSVEQQDKYAYRIFVTGSQDDFMSTLYHESESGVCCRDAALEFCKFVEILDDDTFVVTKKPWEAAGNILSCERWRAIVGSILKEDKKVNALKVPHLIFV